MIHRLVSAFFLVLIIFGTISFLPCFAQITYPTGISANGVNIANNYAPYTVNANAVSGFVHVDSISVNPPNSGASLQLNAVLHVTTTNGTVDYWVQNVLGFFNTNYQSSAVMDNVWKWIPSDNSPSSSLKVCVKIPFTSHHICRNEEFLFKESDSSVYKLPFEETLVITEQLVPEKGIEIQFMYIENGITHVYDTRMLAIPNVTSASLLVTSNQTIENYLSYDTEFVWGGGSNGGIGNFTAMNSTLSLFYNDGGNNLVSWTPFPGYSNVGYDTAETAQNIYSTINPQNNGTAFVELGTPQNQNTVTQPTPAPSTQPTTTNGPQTQPITNTPQYQQNYSPLTISTDKQSYINGDTIQISGRINATSSDILKFWVADSNDYVIYSNQIDAPPNSSFTWNIPTGSNLWHSGTYTLSVQYGSTAFAQKTFVLTSTPPQITPQPTPQTTVTPSQNMPFPITGYVNVQGTSVIIPYGISNARILQVKTDPQDESVIISIKSTGGSGILELDLPTTLMEPGNFASVDGKNVGWFKMKTYDGTSFDVDFPDGSQEIEIFGSQVVVPEFGTLTSVVFLIGVITTLVISVRLSSHSHLT